MAKNKNSSEQTKDKRGHGEGSVTYDEDRDQYIARFFYKDPATGQIERKKFVGKKGGRQGEVLKRGRDWLQQKKEGILSEADKITLGEWMDRWLADYVKPKVRLKSYDKYKCGLDLYVRPKFGNLKMVLLKAPELQRMFNDMMKRKVKVKKMVKQEDGTEAEQEVEEDRPLSTSVVKATRRYLIMCLDQAVKIGLLTRNVVRDTEPPKLVTREIKPLSKEEAALLTETAKKTGDLAYMVILLTLSTGMRLGEVFGLRWSDVDLDKGIIRVQQALITSMSGKRIALERKGPNARFDEPKTKASRRQIPLPKDVARKLRLYKKWQEWQQNTLGDLWQGKHDLVFTNAMGGIMDTSNFTSRVFKRLLKEAGLDENFKFHDLRHTHATLLLLAGVNAKIVQERLGHSTITMTLDTYSHLMPGMQDIATNALQGMFTGEKSEQAETESKEEESKAE